MSFEIENSKRLRFEMMTDKHAELLFELDQDPEVMRFITDGKTTTRREIETKYVPRMESYTDVEKGWGIWGVWLRDSSQFAGWILVRPMHFFDAARNDDDLELGWRFKQKFWGKGIATEAALAVMKALQSSGVRQFTAMAREENVASTSVMKKIGMSYRKTDLHKDPLGESMVVYYSRVVGE